MAGVYLPGALPRALRRWLEAPSWRERFVGKGPFEAAMQQVPVRLVAHPDPVLLGAACLALQSTVAPATAPAACAAATAPMPAPAAADIGV